jgi:starvation-inducible DNA-binding protein
MKDLTDPWRRQAIDLAMQSGLSTEAIRDISSALTALLADLFALYCKAKNFHWHMAGPHFRDYHILLDEQSTQILSMTDAVAGRVRKIGGITLHSISHISRLQRVLDNDATHVTPSDMLAELGDDNKALARHLRLLHELCVEHRDLGTARFIETWIDEAEGRAWFLFETTRSPA